MKKTGIFCFILSFFAVFCETKAAELPTCQDERLVQIISEQVKSINNFDAVSSPLNIRTFELILKYVNMLKDAEIEKFDSKEEFAISDKIMELKINKNLNLEDMHLCKGEYQGEKNRMFALLYKDGDNVRVFAVTSIADKRKETEITIEN